MRRVRLVHWKAAEAVPRIESLRKAGYAVEYDEKTDSSQLREWRNAPPDAFVIDLTRLPSQGREVAITLRNYRETRMVPLVFVDGEEAKVERVRQVLPDAAFTNARSLMDTLKRVLRSGVNAGAEPVRPVPMMDRYGGRSVVEKLGIKPNQAIALLDPPGDLETLLPGLPEGSTWAEADDRRAGMGLYFVMDADGLRAAFDLAKRQKNLKKLWIARRKAQTAKKPAARAVGVVPEDLVRETGLAMGFVDYKVCAISEVWSGLLFARRKS